VNLSPATDLAFTTNIVQSLNQRSGSISFTVATTMSLITLADVDQIPRLGSCGSIPAVNIIETVSGSTKTHTSNTPSTYPVPAFTIDVSTCTNTAFQYSLISDLPTFVTYDPVNIVFSFNSVSASDVGQYPITIKGVLTNGLEKFATFTLDVQSHCGSLILSSMNIPDITYYISGETIEKVLPVYPVTDPQCVISYLIEGGYVTGSTFTTVGFPSSQPVLLDAYHE
jgi:hypothetical protein